VSSNRFSLARITRVSLAVLSSVWLGAQAYSQPPSNQSQSQHFTVGSQSQRLEMSVNTSRILALEGKVKIPRVFVNDPSVVQATPISPSQVQIAALKPGVTQVNLWDEKGEIYTVDVVATRDASELRELLRTEFPEATLRVRPLAESVYITGYVPRPEMVDEIISVAREYYDKVINGIVVGGVQQVALHVKVMEVSRTKLRQFGLDWEFLGDDAQVQQGAGGLIAAAFDHQGRELVPGNGGDTVRFRVFSDAADFTGYLQALRRYDLAKLLAEPTLVTMTGRPAKFNSGGSFPILVPNGLGTVGIEFRQYGTRVDFAPIVLGNGKIHLEVRPSVSEPDKSQGIQVNGITVPGLTERYVETSVEMQAGQTLALAGLIQNRVEAQNQGVPFLADLPYVGRLFSRVEERVNEVELLVIVTPELVGPLDPHQVPQCGPGQFTVSPNDCELYNYGYPEVPNCSLVAPRPDGSCAPERIEPIPLPPVNDSPAPPAGPLPPAPSNGEQIPPPPQTPPTELNSPSTAARSRYAPVYRQPPTSHANAPALHGPFGYDPLRY
jgi:pilus assembly protein CpaC